MELVFDADLWLYPGKAGWHFVTLPRATGQQVKFYQGQDHGLRRGFGAVKVIARIGNTAWTTSLFPDAKSESYLLPIKADVRSGEKLAPGATVKVTLNIDM
jgi:Domain of unknown function (DUF1905)